MKRLLVLGTITSLAMIAGWTGQAAAQTKKVLMFTRSQAYEHEVVRRGPKGELSLAERTVTELGKKNGFEVTCTKDGGQINTANLKNYQAVFFYTQGDLDKAGGDKQPVMKADDMPAILEFVKNGGGFIGTHCGGADTFHHWVENGKKPFLDMVGGEFIGHGAQRKCWVETVDSNFPATKNFDKAFELHDEWYAYQGFDKDMRILQFLKTDGMPEAMYKRPNYPITWCKSYGKGRVFYTGMGHRTDVWENAKYQEMIGQAVLWSLGSVDGKSDTNLKELFGDEEAALKRINPPKTK